MENRLWVLWVTVCLSGCFFRQGTVVSRFSGEFQCPEAQVQITKQGDERYQATGCNRRASYRCTGEYGELCERVGQPETINPLLGQEAPPPPPVAPNP